MTERLYYDDPFRLAFRARVVAHGAWGGAPSVVLDRTAFYPESGGQMADRGALAGVPVVDVQLDDAGVVHHVVAGTLPAIGDDVEGAIDGARRRVHMALHTGQHMLSRALVERVRGETVSSRLGETACTIDIDQASVDERELARAEDLVNSVVDDDVGVRAFFPEPDELVALPLRRAPKVSDHVRVVAIGDFDVSPCGGTHCTRTGQVGLVRVTGVERYKGKIRVTFAAGRRARDELWSHADVLQGLARDLTCGPAEVPTALAKLRRDLTDAREALGQARARLAAATAEELIARARAAGRTLVVAMLDDGDVETLRHVARRITAESDLVALLATRTAEGQHVLCARGAEALGVDCGALLKRVAAAAGGRGGGKADRAEGRLPTDADWVALVTAAG